MKKYVGVGGCVGVGGWVCAKSEESVPSVAWLLRGLGPALAVFCKKSMRDLD